MRYHWIVYSSLLSVLSSAHAEQYWPEYLDVDLNYRHSAALDSDRQWYLRFGAGLESEPTYQGSDRNETGPDPFLVAAYRADWGNIFLTGGGFGYSRMLTESFGISLQLEAEDAREATDDSRLAGLGDQEQELELEIMGRYFRGPLAFGASVAPATGGKGVVWFAGASYTWRSTGERLFVTLGSDISGSTKENQQTDFGITEVQSTASAFPVYTPGGGLKSFGVNFAAEYKLTEHWFFNAGIDYENLLGDVADSPLVFATDNIEGSVGAFYRF